MIVADVYDEAKRVFGACDQATLFRKITEAVELVVVKAAIPDALTAELTVCACENIITLPRFVGVPLGINVNGVASIPRDKWYIYHINGTGGRQFQYNDPRYWDDCGERPTIREFPHICTLMAVPQYATDDGKAFRVFGNDENDKPIWTLNSDGTTTEGFPLVLHQATPIINLQKVKWIQRIVRQATNGFVKLYAIDQTTGESFLCGDYEPDETEPNYRRIRVQCKSSVHMRYRRNTLAVKNLNDFIPLNNRRSLIFAMQAINAYDLLKTDDGLKYEQQAARLAVEEQQSRNAPSGSGPQINVFDGAHNETLYGYIDAYPGYGDFGGGNGF